MAPPLNPVDGAALADALAGAIVAATDRETDEDAEDDMAEDEASADEDGVAELALEAAADADDDDAAWDAGAALDEAAPELLAAADDAASARELDAAVCAGVCAADDTGVAGFLVGAGSAMIHYRAIVASYSVRGETKDRSRINSIATNNGGTMDDGRRDAKRLGWCCGGRWMDLNCKSRVHAEQRSSKQQSKARQQLCKADRNSDGDRRGLMRAEMERVRSADE